jgi:phage terminase large subunit GpA-like protein
MLATHPNPLAPPDAGPPPRDRLLRGFAEAWQPRERLSLAQWCEKNISLPEKTGPNPGRVDFDRYPYTPGILDAAEDPETEEIVYVAATQVSKTTTLQLILAGLSQLRPAPAMLCAPDSDSCKRLRDKFYFLCEASAGLRDRIPPQHLRNMDAIDFGTSLAYLAWTGNPQRVSGESCRVVLVTETDRSHRATHEGALHKLIGERTKAWHDFLQIFEGTPTDQTSTIWDMLEKSTFEQWHCPCPHCGHYQPLRFFPHEDGEYAGGGGVVGIKRDDGSWLSPEEAREAAYYRCEKGCTIHARDKNAMVARGVWCPRGCKIGTGGAVEGAPKNGWRRRGFHLNSLYSPVISVGRMAAEYLDSRDNEGEYRNFINNWCGERYIERTRTPKAHVLWRRLRGSHRLGTVPSQALFLTSGFDCHADNAHWIVRAWGEGGTSWLVDFGIQPRQLDDNGKWILDSHLQPLLAIINREWPLVDANPIGQLALKILKTGVDSGHEPLTVHNFCRQFHPDEVFCVAGMTNEAAGLPYKFSIVERNQRTGKAYPGGMRRWAINTSHFKADIHQRWEAPLDEPGAWWLPNAAWDSIDAYCRQVTNEGRVIERHRRTGVPRMVWRVIQDAIGNHFFDCEVYARALADMIVGGDWTNLTERFRALALDEARRSAPTREDDDQPGFRIRRPTTPFGRSRNRGR